MVPVDARGGAPPALANRPGAAGVLGGVVLLLLLLPCLLGAYAAFFQAGHNRALAGWAAGLTLFLLLTSTWLAWAGVVLVSRRPAASLLAPGIVGLVAAAVGGLVNLPHALMSARATEGVVESRAILMLTATIGVAAVGNILAARGSSSGRALHWLSPLGALAGIAFVLYQLMHVAD
jgi:hypothetical protein